YCTTRGLAQAPRASLEVAPHDNLRCIDTLRGAFHDRRSPSARPPVELLSAFERISFRAMELLFRRARPISEAWLRTVGAAWMTLGSRNMMVPIGLERLRGLSFDDGILLVSNHRSFFDLYMLMLLLHRYTPLRQPVMCPVRADYFYQRIDG